MIFLLPLLSALIYVAGALLLKRAAELGAGTWRIAWICNLTVGIVFAPLALLGGPPPWEQLWQPALVGLLFVLGQVLTIRSLRIGDVSVATPVLGLKVILVALFTTLLLHEPVASSIWFAALLSSVAIALLHVTRTGSHHRVGSTTLLASLAAASYALLDVLVQRWSGPWGLGRFLPVMMGLVALSSLPMRRLSQGRGPASGSATVWLVSGAVCFAVQSAIFISTIVLYGQATVTNILYSSRGLWSVLAVWVAGKWLQSAERQHGRRVLAWRLCGAALLMAAILIVLLGRR